MNGGRDTDRTCDPYDDNLFVLGAASEEDGLTIAEAKRRLAIKLSVDPSAIKISI